MTLVFGWIKDALADGVKWLLESLVGMVNSSTGVSFTAAEFLDRYALIWGAGALVAFVLALVNTVLVLYTKQGPEVLRPLVVNLPAAFLAMATAPVVLDLGIQVTDSMTDSLLTGAIADLSDTFAVVVTTAAAAPGLPMLLLVGAFLVALIASAVVWVFLVLRNVGLYAAALWVPLALAAGVHRGAQTWARRLGGFLVAMLLAKPVVAGTFAVGVGAMRQAGSSFAAGDPGGVIAQLVTGSAVMAFSAAMPMGVVKLLVPAAAALSGAGSGLGRLVQAKALMSVAGGGAGGAAAAAVGAAASGSSPMPGASDAGGGGSAPPPFAPSVASFDNMVRDAGRVQSAPAFAVGTPA